MEGMNATQNRIAADTGVLPLPELGLDVGPGTTLAQVDQTGTGRTVGRRRFGDEIHLSFVNLLIADTRFHATLKFRHERLYAIDLFLPQPDDGASWEDWNESSERLRRSAGEAWVRQVFDREMTIKPFVDDQTGTEIMPALPDANHPRYARFDWGEIVSYYDPRAAQAGLLIRYTLLP